MTRATCALDHCQAADCPEHGVDGNQHAPMWPHVRLITNEECVLLDEYYLLSTGDMGMAPEVVRARDLLREIIVVGVTSVDATRPAGQLAAALRDVLRSFTSDGRDRAHRDEDQVRAMRAARELVDRLVPE